MKKILLFALLALPSVFAVAADKPTPAPDPVKLQEEVSRLKVENAQLKATLADLRSAYFQLEATHAELGQVLAKQERDSAQKALAEAQPKPEAKQSPPSEK